MGDSTGQFDLRAENVSSIIKAIVMQEYVMKDLLTVETSSAYQESYYRETNTELTGHTTEAVRGIPRLAAFPFAEPNWTKMSTWIEKYGLESIISYEDIISNNISVLSRTLLKLGRAVVYAVDSVIYTAMSDNAGNSVAITAGQEWNSSTVSLRNPIQNLLDCQKELTIDNYNPYGGNCSVIMGPTDYANLLGNESIQKNIKTADVILNGKQGTLLGMTIRVTNSATADQVLIVVEKEVGTWKEATPLNVFTTEDKGISTKIRAFCLGSVQIQAPNCIVKLTNTAA